MTKDYFDRQNRHKQDHLSRVLLGQEPNRGNAKWEAEMREKCSLLPPVTLLIYQAAIESLRSPIDPIGPNTSVPKLDIALASEYLGPNPDYEKYITLKKEFDQTIINLTRENRENGLLYSTSQVTIKDVEELIALSTTGHTIVPESIQTMSDILASSGQQVKDRTDIDSRILDPVWNNINSTLKEMVVAKYNKYQEEERQIRERTIQKTELNDLKRLQENEKNLPRIKLLFPDLLNHPESGRIYEQRRNLASLVVELFVLYYTTPTNSGTENAVSNLVRPRDYAKNFEMLKSLSPSSADRYPVKPNIPEKTHYSIEESHNLLLHLLSISAHDGDNPIGSNTPLASVRNDIRTIVDYDFEYISADPKAMRKSSDMMRHISELSNRPNNQPDSLERVMQLIWDNKPAKLDIGFYKKILDIFFPAK